MFNIFNYSQTQRLLPLLFLLFFLSGCADTPASYPLMPAPIVYQDTEVDPFAHLQPEERTTRLPIFFATTREPDLQENHLPYGNTPSNDLRLGQTVIRFGNDTTDWQDLYLASTDSAYNDTIDLFIEDNKEIAVIKNADHYRPHDPLSPQQQQFADSINNRIQTAGDKEIIIYVHGAKSSFLTATALTAEVEHFSGRDFIGVAFSWPTHQEIVNYIDGEDIRRGIQASKHLGTLISFLAEHTNTQRINIICYSAGGEVVSRALHDMGLKSPELSAEQFLDKYRLGTILFTAADISVDNFLDRLPLISKMSQRVIVTISDGDKALYTASILMKGGKRIGMKSAEAREEAFAIANNITNFEIVDVSFAQEIRGFDITGHHYWYRHPWTSSDIIILLRTDLPAKHRGLSYSELEDFWYLSDEYPSRVRKAVAEKLKNRW